MALVCARRFEGSLLALIYRCGLDVGHRKVHSCCNIVKDANSVLRRALIERLPRHPK